MTNNKKLDIFGHRGAAAEAPENTLFGIQYAISQGCYNFEIDVRLSADRQLVLSHDANLLRTTGLDKTIHNSTVAELASCVNLFNASHALYRDENQAQQLTEENRRRLGVPTLESILNDCPEIERLQIEVKSDSSTDLFGTIDALGKLFSNRSTCKKIVVTSFDIAFLRLLKKKHVHIPIGVVDKQRIPHAITTASALGCDYLCIHNHLLYRNSDIGKSLDISNHSDAQQQSMLEAAQSSGIHISVWTVNQKDEFKQLQQFPVNSIISDFPSQLLQY